MIWARAYLLRRDGTYTCGNMIKFSLRCANGHSFESWFQSGPAFDTLCQRDLVTCPDCGTTQVEKALMAPSIKPRQKVPPADIQQKLAALRAEIEANTDYVGDRFAHEARAMYLGEIPDRPIHGEAKPEETKALIDDGIPVLPLPFLPSRKTN